MHFSRIHTFHVLALLSAAILIIGCAEERYTKNQDVSKKDSLPGLQSIANAEPLNVVFILSDDHRYDFMGFLDTGPYLKTPNMDRMAPEGACLKNAFVTTSLCSSSRASILTGRHGVVDNQSPVPESTLFFPQYLQKAGYQTAFIGKLHMGHHSAEPRKGFDYGPALKGRASIIIPHTCKR